MTNFRLSVLTAISAFPLLSFVLSRAQAASTQLISTQVKVSICGNYVIEGGEDCEGLDLGGQNCYSLGFGGGQLSCDIACSFDTYECLAPIITPTPSVVPTASPTQVQEDQVTTGSDVLATTTDYPPVLFGNQLVVTLLEQAASVRVLPAPLQKFDIRGEGRLRLEDLSNVVTLWVQDWRAYLMRELSAPGKTSVAEAPATEAPLPIPTAAQGCDLNQDDRCNLIDFSILLHYIEEEQ